MKLRKVMATILAAALTFSMAACGNGGGTTTDATPTPAQGDTNANNDAQGTGNTDTPATPSTSGGTNDEIIIGSWWLEYYDSASESMDVSVDWTNAQESPDDSEETKKTKATNRQIAQLKWDNVAKIEEEYGVEFYFENLTFTGVEDSINTSILAGAPDCDIYRVDAKWAIPAQTNGLALDLKTFLPADHDIFTEQKIAAYHDMGDGKACIFFSVSAQDRVADTYPLAFNVQMLEDNNLEDPRELYKRGEWTWDKFIEYCQVLTQDTDGDGQKDQYGYCGFINETFEQLMMSNGANVARGTTQTLTSSEVGETLQMIQDMYNSYQVCYPYDTESGDDSTSMRNQYCEGNIGFFPIAVWIQGGNANYSTGTPESNLTWDIAYVRWPVGPSGNQETNAGKNVLPNGFMIPAGVEEPEKVFNVLYDFWDWNDGDISLRDNEDALWWWYEENARDKELQVANFNCMADCGSISTSDLWNSLGFYYDFISLINGTMTPAQFQETYKQQVQDGLDSYFGN